MSAPVTVRPRAVLLVVSLALMMVVSAVSGLNVALPDLQRSTGATATEVQWIVDAYTLVFAGLLLPAGALGDRFGRRRILLVAVLLFGAASAVGLVADDPQVLIAVRAVMGVGAAGVMPVTLSVITTSFPLEERARAIGVWVGVAGGGAVIGLLGAGVLLELFSWSSFFGLNVTLAVLALVGTLVVIPDSRAERPPALDPIGAALSLLAVAGVVFGFIEGPERGWSDPLTVGGFVLGVLAGTAFVAWSSRREEPMLDPRLFRRRGFSTGSLSVTAQFFASFGFFFIALQYLQFVAGLSPLEAAVALLPLPAVMIPLARQAPRLALRVGANRVMATGLTLSACGMVAMSTLSVELDYPRFALSLAVFAAGMAMASTPATMTITSSLPADKQGVGSAVNDVSRELGSALGIAILGSVLTAGYRDGVAPAVAGLPPDAAASAESSLPAVREIAPQLGDQGARLAATAEQAFVDAAGHGFLVAAALLVVAAVVVLWRGPGAAELHEALGEREAGEPATQDSASVSNSTQSG